MATQAPTAITYSGQFSNQTLPIIAFASALRALYKKMGIVRWVKNKNFAGANVGPGAQVPIPYVGRIATEAVSPSVTPTSPTALNNQSRYMILDTWTRSKGFAMTAQELNIFNVSSVVPRALERSVQALGEAFEQSAANLAYAFPAIAGAPNVAAFASTADAITSMRTAMSLNLCPNSDDVALFLTTTDVGQLKKTDDYKKNPQLAGLARAEMQYGKAMLGEILDVVLFENQFIKTRQPGTYTGATIALGAAASTATMAITMTATSANCVVKTGDAFKIVSADAPEGYAFAAASEDKTLTIATPTSVAITQPLEFSCSNVAVVTPLITDAAGYSPYENLAITPDAIAIANRVLRVGDLAERIGAAFDVTDDDSPENDYLGTGLTFTLKNFPGSYQEQWESSIFYGMTWADVRLGGRLLSRGVAI